MILVCLIFYNYFYNFGGVKKNDIVICKKKNIFIF